MSLETIVTALGKFMKNEVTAADAPLYEDLEALSVMQTYLTEQHARPDLVALVKAPSLMYEYLSLPLDEREKLERFRQERPDYLEGEGKGKYLGTRGIPLISKSSDVFLRKIRYISQIQKMFDVYLQYREEGDTFNQNVFNNKLVNPATKKLSRNVNQKARIYFKGGYEELIRLTSEYRPEILKHLTFKDVFLIDGPQQLTRVFDYYLKNKKDRQKLSPSYISKNEDLNKDLKRLGRRVYANARLHLPGGIKELVGITERIRPEIKEYWSCENSHISFSNIVDRFVDGFKRWCNNDREKLSFNLRYLNKIGLCSIEGWIRRRSNWDSVLKEAIKINPEIKEHWNYSSIEQKSLSRDEALMRVILENPKIPTTKAYALAGMSHPKGSRAKNSLLNQCLIKVSRGCTNTFCLEAIPPEAANAS